MNERLVSSNSGSIGSILRGICSLARERSDGIRLLEFRIAQPGIGHATISGKISIEVGLPLHGTKVFTGQFRWFVRSPLEAYSSGAL